MYEICTLILIKKNDKLFNTVELWFPFDTSKTQDLEVLTIYFKSLILSPNL